MLIKNMADQVEDKRLEGISDIRDESDRNGMRIVIELKRDANPQVVLNRLFAQTQLQTTFAINMLALVHDQKQPKILSLRQILDEYIAFQEQIITRRTIYDLQKAQERAHLLEGLLIAQDNIDEVIQIIRTSYDNAKERLMTRFGLDDVQAQAILDMRLKALQGLDREKLEAEYKELEERIAYYDKLLSDEGLLRQVLKDELTEIRDKYGDDRKTEIAFVEDDWTSRTSSRRSSASLPSPRRAISSAPPVSEYAAQSKGGHGQEGHHHPGGGLVVDVFTASTHDYLLFFTDTGKVYRKKGYQIPEAGKTAKGTNIVNILQVEQGEKVQTMIHTRELDNPDLYLVMVTRNGTVKRCPPVGPEEHPQQAASGPCAWRRATSSSPSGRPTAPRRSSSPPTTAWRSASTRTTCVPWAGTPWACGASACGRATMWWAPPGPRRPSPSSPSPRRATASARPWRSTASPTGAAWASRTTLSPRRPAAWWASRWWTAARTCCWSPRAAS